VVPMIPRPKISPSCRRGAMLPLVALLLPVMLILASFVVNVAYMQLTRTELRIASDAATRAASHTLMTTGNRASARAAAKDGANRNKVAGKATKLANSDIVFGISRRQSLSDRYNFTPGNNQANAVKVNARRDAGSLSGMVSMITPTFGAAKNFGPAQAAISTQVEVDLALVLDRSGSMAYSDAENSSAMASAGLPPASAPAGWEFCDPAPPDSRWRALVDAVQIFTTVLKRSPQQEFLGLATYSDDAKREVDLSSAYDAVPAAMATYTNSYCSGFTNIHAGITEGINVVGDPSSSRPWAAKVIIVMTDGRRTAGPDPVAAAEAAFRAGITVYTVTFSEEADVGAMRQVAAKGGGQHFHAVSSQDLRDVFKTIAGELPTLLTQ